MKNRNIITILSLLFIGLSILVCTNTIQPFDSFIYNIVTFKMNDTITFIYKIITFLGSTEFIIFLCCLFLVLFIMLKKKNIGLIITSMLIVSTIINNLIKIIIRRERPNILMLVEESTFSYPSGHTMAAVTMYGILMYIVLKSNMNKKLKIVLAIILGIIPILVGLSRVYLGAHYISDVIGSFLVSTILILISINIIDKKKWL